MCTSLPTRRPTQCPQGSEKRRQGYREQRPSPSKTNSRRRAPTKVAQDHTQSRKWCRRRSFTGVSSPCCENEPWGIVGSSESELSPFARKVITFASFSVSQSALRPHSCSHSHDVFRAGAQRLQVRRGNAPRPGEPRRQCRGGHRGPRDLGQRPSGLPNA